MTSPARALKAQSTLFPKRCAAILPSTTPIRNSPHIQPKSTANQRPAPTQHTIEPSTETSQNGFVIAQQSVIMRRTHRMTRISKQAVTV
jgi:hypothetical protein